MTSTVRVYNDNIHPHKEKFKGDLIEIPPKCFIEMDFYDAVEFRGQYSPIGVDGGGTHIPISFKMIRIVKPEEFHVEDSKKINCNSCGQIFATAPELEDHVIKEHIDQMVDETEKKKRIKLRKAS